MKLVKKNKKRSSVPSKDQESDKHIQHLDKKQQERTNEKGSNMGNYLQDKWFPRTK